jgi:hypothetical protein
MKKEGSAISGKSVPREFPMKKEGSAISGSQQATEAAWLGYTFRELHQIAARATVYCRWGDRFPFAERFEIAWAGVVDHLTGCEQPPESFDLYKAGMRAIGRASDRELREHGVTRGSDGLQAMPSFDVYWAHKTSPAADAAVVDRLAVRQIWPMLRPLHQMAFLALAAHGDYYQAALATGYPYSTFSVLITQARAEFLRLWHEGEAPSRIWAADKHGDTDPVVRARRVLAARRRKRHQHPPGTGPASVQATA